MTSLRTLAIGATLCGALLFGTTTSAWAQGPSTTIVNNGNRNINIVLNIQGPQINVNVPGLGGLPIGGHHGGYIPPAQNVIFNAGHGNVNRIQNFGGVGPTQNQIVNLGNFNRNLIRNR